MRKIKNIKRFLGLIIIAVLSVQNFSGFCIAFPVNAAEESKSSNSNNSIWIDFSEYSGNAGELKSKIKGRGIDVSPNGDGVRPSIDIYGDSDSEKWCVKAGDYIYFYITDEIIKQCETVTFEVSFYDDSAGDLRLEYCSSYPGNFQDGYHLYYLVNIPGGGTNQFVKTALTLECCNFTYGHNQGAQFRFSGNAAVESVKITPGALPDPINDSPPDFSPQTEMNNILGKGVTGYQAWFQGGTGANGWSHWGHGSARPAQGKTNIEIYPDVSEYRAAGAQLYQTDLGDLGDGTPSELFSSKDETIIDTHFKWMRDAGIDGAAVQRFFEATSPTESTIRNHLEIIRDKAEKYGRSFYIMYDMSASGRYESEAMIKRIQLDFIYNVERKGLAGSFAYAHADGKPVVCLWGIHGVKNTENNRYPGIEDTIRLVEWFRGRGYYVIGGVPDDEFYTRKGGGKDMFASFDMLSPWYVGRDVNAITGNNGRMIKAMKFCEDNPRIWADNKPIDFQPVVWAGFAWTNMSGNTGSPNAIPRNAGQFLWNQMYQYINLGAGNFYFAMFDEYDEATAIMKSARDFFDVPDDQYFLTLATDGKWLSSDFYLRAAKACIEMLKGKSELRPTIDIPHSEGPIYWRNSFERRGGRQKSGGDGSIKIKEIPDLPLDVCVPNGGTIEEKTSGIEIDGRVNEMIKSDAKSGESSFRLGGTVNVKNGSYYYKIADTKINSKGDSELILAFSLKPENDMGRNVYVDLILDGNEYLSDILPEYAGIARGTVGQWNDIKINIPESKINGREITGVAIAYSGDFSSGSFSALIDDISIFDPSGENQTDEEESKKTADANLKADNITNINNSDKIIILVCSLVVFAAIAAGTVVIIIVKKRKND